ncbi:MAG: F0F1 ATP synthase subunit gamma [Rhodobacteraceae bacterium]|nr:MAG: F0F1 ATP synthase subunit gamma [Paracoccaceae bacterium]|tara:strand:- start:2826 stop:3710 length:885 start_codon:yes stop_codon:yes gene_type:complete
MPNLKDLKIRIESVKSTRKITKAMQMVAAAKLRKAQEAAEEARPYASRMTKVLDKLTSSNLDTTTGSPLLIGAGKSEKYLVIVATSERGLCGAFNSSIVRLAKSHISNLLSDGKSIEILTIGKKGREQLKREFGDSMIDHVDLSQIKKMTYEEASIISGKILEKFAKRDFDVAIIFYNQFESVISQVPKCQQLIPVERKTETDTDGEVEELSYFYEPDEQEIMEDLLPKAITAKIFTALLENGASEQGARMSAMDNATRNAGEMIDKLTIQFNRSRQAAITNELIEIISGAEAL